MNQVYDVANALKENGNIISVGYMLRYLRAVQKMKQIIHDNNLTVMATNARYVSLRRGAATPALLCGVLVTATSPCVISSRRRTPN